VKQGGELYDRHCMICHGLNAVAGPIPDLRYASAQTHTPFEQIVRGGTRASLGMPAFADLLSGDQVKAIQQYVLSRAHESATARRNSVLN